MAWKEGEEIEFNESNFWEPEKGDELQGEVMKKTIGTYEKYFLVIAVTDDEGETTEWITQQCASLHKKITHLNIQIGDTVLIRYNGRKDDEYNSHDFSLFKWEED